MMFLWKLYNYVLRAHFCVMMQWKSAAHRFSNRRTTTKSFNKKWTKLINEIFKVFFLGWFLMVLPFTFGFQHPKSCPYSRLLIRSPRKQAEVWWHLNSGSGKYLTEVFPAKPIGNSLVAAFERLNTLQQSINIEGNPFE